MRSRAIVFIALAEQFAMEPVQRGNIVYIVPRRQHHGLEPNFAGPLDGLREDQRRAPGNLLEEAGMRPFQSDQVIPAILRRAEHEPVTGY